MNHYDQLLDLSGLRCPLPLLKTKNALKKLTKGQILRVISTDPQALSDFKSLARITLLKLTVEETTINKTIVHLEK